MSTRGIIAKTTEDGWIGVIHLHDSAPWDLGNALLIDVLGRDGDLEGLVREVIDQAPGGWAWLPQRDRVPRGEETFFGPVDVEDAGWLEWFYLFDLSRRRLSIYFGGPPTADDDDPAHVVVFGSDGSCEPSVLREPAAPWMGIEPSPGWTHDDDTHATQRAELEDHMQQWCEEQDLPTESSREDVAEALERALGACSWSRERAQGSELEHARLRQLGGDQAHAEKIESPEAVAVAAVEAMLEAGARDITTVPAPGSAAESDGPPLDGAPLRVRFAGHGPDSSYWSVQLGALQVLYPSGGSSRLDETLDVYAPSGWLSTIEDLEQALAQQGEDELARELALISTLVADPRQTLEYDEDGEIFDVTNVVDSDAPGDGEASVVALRESGYEVDVGDELLRPVPRRLSPYLLLDWIRLGQVPSS